MIGRHKVEITHMTNSSLSMHSTHEGYTDGDREVYGGREGNSWISILLNQDVIAGGFLHRVLLARLKISMHGFQEFMKSTLQDSCTVHTGSRDQ